MWHLLWSELQGVPVGVNVAAQRVYIYNCLHLQVAKFCKMHRPTESDAYSWEVPCKMLHYFSKSTFVPKFANCKIIVVP